MSSPIKSLMFAAMLCIVCSVLLTAANTGLKPLQQRNMAVDRHKNILVALGLIQEGQTMASDQVEALYNENVKSLWVDRDGRILSDAQRPSSRLALYLYVKQGKVEAYVVPINTRGLWGEIQGYLAIDNDGATIRGFTVYKHQETPGLGGEIESRWFRKNFENKKIIDASGNFASIAIAKGAVQDVVPQPKRPNYVDGISGATMTGKFLTAGLKDILREYEPVSIAFRHKNPRYLRAQ